MSFRLYLYTEIYLHTLYSQYRYRKDGHRHFYTYYELSTIRNKFHQLRTNIQNLPNCMNLHTYEDNFLTKFCRIRINILKHYIDYLLIKQKQRKHICIIIYSFPLFQFSLVPDWSFGSISFLQIQDIRHATHLPKSPCTSTCKSTCLHHDNTSGWWHFGGQGILPYGFCKTMSDHTTFFARSPSWSLLPMSLLQAWRSYKPRLEIIFDDFQIFLHYFYSTEHL